MLVNAVWLHNFRFKLSDEEALLTCFVSTVVLVEIPLFELSKLSALDLAS